MKSINMIICVMLILTGIFGISGCASKKEVPVCTMPPLVGSVVYEK